MNFWRTAVATVSLLFSLHAFAAPSATEVKNCETFLKLPKAEQNKIAKKTGHSTAMAIWGCQGLIRIAHHEHATPLPGANTQDAEPAWYGDTCEVSRFCPANSNCIRGMCRPTSYGGCDNGYDSCPAVESCVSGSCQ